MRRLGIHVLGLALVATNLLAPAALRGADGDLDPAFHGDGRYLTDFGLFGDFGVSDAMEAPDGRWVVTGIRRPDGSAPPRFFWQAIGSDPATTDGRCELPPPGGGTDVSGGAGAFDLQGRLVIAGGAVYGGLRRLAVARYLYPDCTLDPAFDGDGYATFDLGAGEEWVEDLAIESHGRILLAGVFDSGGQRDALVVRLLGGGALDTGFNFVGWTHVDVFAESADDIALAAGTVPAGGLLADATWVAGWSADPDTQPGGGPGSTGFVLAFLADGTPDPDFGTLPQQGVVAVEYARWDYLRAGTWDARGGRLLFVGWSATGSPPVGQQGTTLTALDPHYGFFSTTLDGDGRMQLGVAQDLEAIAVDGLGRIVLAGTSYTSSNLDFAVYRLAPDGAFDPAFSGDGRAFVGFDAGGPDPDRGRAVALGPGGVLVAGEATSALGDPVVGAARLRSALLFADGLETGAPGAWSSASP